METLGYAAAIFIGLVLGLIGGGGSILTVPALVYLMNVPPTLATGYSLFVVGLTALFGAYTYYQKDLVSVKTAIIFAIPSFIAVYIVRKFVVPALPDELFSIGSFLVTRDIAIMGLFAVLMIAASISMIKKRKRSAETPNETDKNFDYPLIIIEGFVVGALTGLVGAGGGFLIIPALVLFANLPMKLAVGTSLLIIAFKSLIGFIGDMETQTMNWLFLATFSSLTIAGIFIGGYVSKYVSSDKLKPAFGWFTLIMGIYIISTEIVKNGIF